MHTTLSCEHKKDVLLEWRESAPYWAKHAATVRSLFAPITAALIEAARISKGQTVLDIAGGSGEPSLTLAERVGGAGLVACTDATLEMVMTARNEARFLGLTNLEFARCAGESLAFSDNIFDAVVCRLGIMLFSDPASAIRESLRVLKPGGRASFAVWHTLDSNPFFSVVVEVVSRFVESPPEEPDSPGAFRFAERGKLAGLLSEAGAADVTERLIEFDLEAPITPREFWEARSELSDTLRAKLASLSSEDRKQIAKEVEQAGAAFFKAGRMKFPGEVLIVTGTNV